MRTKRWAGLLALVLLLSLCGGALATAARVYDGADLFTASEEAALEEEIARFEQQHPDCATNWLVYSSTGAQWRESYKYDQYRRMFIHRIWEPFQEP